MTIMHHQLPADAELLTLVRGPWKALVVDPGRPVPSLGSRYCHGGLIAALWHDGRLLTGSPEEAWTPYAGGGLPDSFELPLGACSALEGDPLLRIGCGLVRRMGEGWSWAGAPLERPAAWTVEILGPGSVAMTAEDAVGIAGKQHAYRLQRRLTLTDHGVVSTTALRVACPWSHPVVWFSHPFVHQTAGDATTFDLGPGAQPRPALTRRPADGRWAFAAKGGFAPVEGLWGQRTALAMHCDPALGGGCLTTVLDRPLEKAVVWANTRAASVEPYFSRTWLDGEEATWEQTFHWMG